MITKEEKLQLIQLIIAKEPQSKGDDEETRDTARALFDRLFPKKELDAKSTLSTAWLDAVRKLRAAPTNMTFDEAIDTCRSWFVKFGAKQP